MSLETDSFPANEVTNCSECYVHTMYYVGPSPISYDTFKIKKLMDIYIYLLIVLN